MEWWWGLICDHLKHMHVQMWLVLLVNIFSGEHTDLLSLQLLAVSWAREKKLKTEGIKCSLSFDTCEYKRTHTKLASGWKLSYDVSVKSLNNCFLVFSERNKRYALMPQHTHTQTHISDSLEDCWQVSSRSNKTTAACGILNSQIHRCNLYHLLRLTCAHNKVC